MYAQAKDALLVRKRLAPRLSLLTGLALSAESASAGRVSLHCAMAYDMFCDSRVFVETSSAVISRSLPRKRGYIGMCQVFVDGPLCRPRVKHFETMVFPFGMETL